MVKPLPPIKDLFTRTWDGYKRRVRSVITVYVWATLGLLGTVAACVASFAVPAIVFPSAAPMLIVSGVGILVAALFLVGMFFQSAAVGVALQDGIVPSEAVAHAKKDWKAFTWANLASGIVGTLAFGAFLIPGILLAPALRLVEYAFKVEGKRGLDALLHAHALVRGRWWAVVGRMVLFGILVGIVPEILDAAAPTSGLQTPLTAAEASVDALQFAYAFLLAGPLALVFGAELYKDVALTASSATPAVTAKGRRGWILIAVAGAVLATAALLALWLTFGKEAIDALVAELNVGG